MKQLEKNISLTNLANSILKYFGAPTYHSSIPEVDELLKKSNKKKVCLFLFDAFSASILEKHKDIAPFMYEHRFMKIKSVFPTTTVACTTAVLTGKYPIETGYLGWVQKFDDLNCYAETYTSTCRTDRTLKFNPIITNSLLKTEFITDDINRKHNKEVAQIIYSYNHKSRLGIHQSIRKFFKFTDKNLGDKLFTYCYCENPDYIMHRFGTDHEKVRTIIKLINDELRKLVNKHQDTLFLAISDHGMINVLNLNIKDIEGFNDLLVDKLVIIESRFASFNVKDKKAFEKFYKNTPILNENFDYIDKNYVLENHIFGYSDNINKVGLQSIKDCFLVAKSNYCLVDDYATGSANFKGTHAGIMDEEEIIYLQAYNTK